jgi:hypothetical protein
MKTDYAHSSRLYFCQKTACRVLTLQFPSPGGAKSKDFASETLVSAPKTLVFAPETLVFVLKTLVSALETLVFVPETLVFVLKTLVFALETLVFAPETLVSVPKTLVFNPASLDNISQSSGFKMKSVDNMPFGGKKASFGMNEEV